MSQKNGNNQINEERENVNNRVSRYSIIGNSKRNFWNRKRRFRTI